MRGPTVYRGSMTHPWLAATLVGALATASAAQELTATYRDYTLGESLSSVVATSGERYSQPRTLHTRPVLVQTFEWRAPFGDPSDREADAVRDMLFSFVDDRLYRIDVHYDRDRTRGLVVADLVESIAVIYGEALPPATRGQGGVLANGDVATVVARWALPGASLTLLQGVSGPEYALALVSTALAATAASGARESVRLDAVEAPRRAAESHRKNVADAKAATSEARARNKPAFRP